MSDAREAAARRVRLASARGSYAVFSSRSAQYFRFLSTRGMHVFRASGRNSAQALYSGVRTMSINPTWALATLVTFRSQRGLTGMSMSRSLSPCWKNSSMIRSYHCLLKEFFRAPELMSLTLMAIFMISRRSSWLLVSRPTATFCWNLVT